MEQKLKIKNYLGYAFCDISGMLAFSALGAYLSVFYTDILMISTTSVFYIMLFSRIWDGINDPIMGFLVQKRKPDIYGKYRSFILYGGIPLAIISAFTMYKVPNMSTGFYTFYAATTYILYGMLYTVVLVPYGSMASVMTRKENERSILSICRSVGGGIGSLPATICFPLIVMVNNVMDKDRLFISMCAISILMIICYYISFRWTKEYIPSKKVPDKVPLKDALKGLVTDKAFVIMALVGCLLMAGSMYLNTVNVYLFKDYFSKSGLLIFVTIASYIPMILLIPFSNKLINKFGKKSVSIVGLIISVLVTFLMFIIRTKNPIIYIILCFFLNLGTGFLTLEIWAMASDVIDSQELRTGKRQEAISYSAFTFMRKVGQAIASLAPLFVGIVGYDSNLVGKGQNVSTLEGMYTVATIVPCIMYVITLILMIMYPLGKDEMKKMQEGLKKLREEKDE